MLTSLGTAREGCSSKYEHLPCDLPRQAAGQPQRWWLQAYVTRQVHCDNSALVASQGARPGPSAGRAGAAPGSQERPQQAGARSPALPPLCSGRREGRGSPRGRSAGAAGRWAGGCGARPGPITAITAVPALRARALQGRGRGEKAF